MAKEGVKVEFFVPAPACACSGAAFVRDMEKITRLDMIMDQLAVDYPQLEIVRHDMVDESGVSEKLKLLANYLREAGEEDFASRIAFSMRNVLPAVAVNGRLVVYGQVPDLKEIAQAVESF